MLFSPLAYKDSFTSEIRFDCYNSHHPGASHSNQSLLHNSTVVCQTIDMTSSFTKQDNTSTLNLINKNLHIFTRAISLSSGYTTHTKTAVPLKRKNNNRDSKRSVACFYAWRPCNPYSQNKRHTHDFCLDRPEKRLAKRRKCRVGEKTAYVQSQITKCVVVYNPQRE